LFLDEESSGFIGRCIKPIIRDFTGEIRMENNWVRR